MIEAYNKYKSAGVFCLPVSEDKLPAIPKGESWLMGWNNLAEYEKSFGIGVLCGNISGGLECIDFDNHFGDAQKVITDFLQNDDVKSIYQKYKLPIQSTKSGGFHLIYRCTVIEGNQKLASRPKYDADIKKYKKDVLIETRGEGGYFCIDPTPGYKKVRNDLTKIANITPDERQVLISTCKAFNTFAEVKIKQEENKDLPGNRYNEDPLSKTDMINVLRRMGWTELKDGQWLRPGKKKGVSATLDKVAPGIFYNFSSSAYPFEDNHAYTAFQVMALLEYEGDFKRFAKELSTRYNKNENVKPDQLDEIIRKSYIDIDIPVVKPPVILRIKTLVGIEKQFTRVFTLGNFSAIIGKSKAKKTYLECLFMACASRGGVIQDILMADLPVGRPGVVLFDTEQSNYDAYMVAWRVAYMSGNNKNHFGSFDLREFTPIERCNIIERFIEKRSYGVSFIVIDGIADLATAINDEIEASRVVSLLMKWTKVYNVHISVVIHQNKNDNYATGHLGSAIMKKSECVISVTKDLTDNLKSEICCDFIRGTMEFDKFTISIDDKGFPFVVPDFIVREEPMFFE